MMSTITMMFGFHEFACIFVNMRLNSSNTKNHSIISKEKDQLGIPCRNLRAAKAISAYLGKKFKIPCWSSYYYLTMSLVCIILSARSNVAAVTTPTDNCGINMFVYSSSSKCQQGSREPDVIATLFADGVCRTNEIVSMNTTAISASTNTYQNSILPGTYRAICSPNRTMIRFLDSACISPSCSSTSDTSATLVTSVGTTSSDSPFTNKEICTQNTSIPGSFYALAQQPLYVIYNDTNNFGCSKITNDKNVTVTFAFFGSCMDPSCPVDVFDPDDDITLTSISPTSSPSTSSPTTSSPTTTSPPSSESSNSIDTARPVNALNKTISPVAVLVPDFTNATTAPTAAAASEEEASTKSVTAFMDIMGVQGLAVSFLNSSENHIVSFWENTTSTFILASIQNNSKARDAVKRLTVRKRSATEKKTEVVTLQGNSRRYQRNQRMLPDNQHDKQKRMLQSNNANMLHDANVQIMFFLIITYNADVSTYDDITPEQILLNAFDEDNERESYIRSLASSPSSVLYKNVTDVVVYVDASSTAQPSPTPSPMSGIGERPESTNGSTGTNQTTPSTTSALEGGGDSKDTGFLMPIIVTSTVCALVILCVGGYFLYQHGKNDAIKENDQIIQETPTNQINGISASQTTGSSPNLQIQAGKSAQYTNEIVCDPTGDDISTLGGSVLFLGTTGGNNNNSWNRNKQIADDPTATVEHDYDYSKNRFRSGAMNEDATIDDGNATRMTKATQFTSFSKLGISNVSPATFLGSAVTDDHSFDKQFYQDDDEIDYDDNDTYDRQLHEEGIEFDEKNKADPFLVVTPTKKMNKAALDFAPMRTNSDSAGNTYSTPERLQNNNASNFFSSSPVFASSKISPPPRIATQIEPLQQIHLQNSSPQVTVYSSTPPRNAASTSRNVVPTPKQQQSPLSTKSTDDKVINRSAQSNSLPSLSPSQFHLFQPEDNAKNGQPLRYDIHVPPGMLGMVLDAPNGSNPIVRAVKNDSVLANTVQVGDYLVEVDSIDTRPMSAIDVSNLLCIKSNVYRHLVFIRGD